MAVAGAFPRVEKVRALLGPSALLIAWPLGVKAARQKWSKLTHEVAGSEKHFAKLERGNIGVALGSKSAGLCSIDWDDETWLARFLALNPALAGTLRTRGARGCNFWVRIIGDFPPSRKFMVGKEEVGEWRANGNQTIISGKHPDGHDYSFLVDALPVEVHFGSIKWPEGISAPSNGSAHSCTVSHVAQSLSSTDAQAGPASPPPPSKEEKPSAGPPPEASSRCILTPPQLSEFVLPFVCEARGKSDLMLWQMARGIRRLERDAGRKIAKQEQSAIFEAWWARSEAHVDPATEYHDHFGKWQKNCKTARVPDDETSLKVAWNLAQTLPLPPEALALYGSRPLSREKQLAVALCFHLQEINGEEPFFLGYRDLAPLFGVTDEALMRKFYDWLAQLEAFGIIEKVSVGSRVAKKSNEWRFLRRTE